MALTREDLLSQNKRRYQMVPLPTGGEAKIRNLTSAEMRQLRESLQDSRGELHKERAAKLQEILVCRCLVDDDDNRMFTDDDALSGCLDEVDGIVLSALFAAAKNWTGFAIDSDFSALEEAIKNSRNGQASSSDSAQQPV